MGKKNYFSLIALFSIILYFPLISAETTFIRGDANSDSKVDISDQTFIFNYLYLSGEPPKCEDAADVDDNGKIEMTDGVYLRDYLFLGSGKPPAAPYPNAGVDTTNDDLSCGVGEGGALSGSVRLQISQSTYCSKEVQNPDEIKVSGYFDLPRNYQDKCKVEGADFLFFDVLVTLYENDPWPAPDDYISDQDGPFVNPTSDCFRVNFEVSNFPNVEFGLQGGDGEGDTIEVFARAKLRYWVWGETKPREEVGDLDSSQKDIDLVVCQCLPLDREGTLPKGPCCTTTRPYQFKPKNAQPENQQDIYTCTESNNPVTQNDQIKLEDYYCGGSDSKAHSTVSVAANCGVCSYCIQGRSNCFAHDGRETCGTTDCNSKDTDCRNYFTVASACIQGTCTQQPCTAFDNMPQGTNCNNGNGRCDGTGGCIGCTDHGATMCDNNDEYWARKCGPVIEKQELKKDCGEDSCDGMWFHYCEGDNLMKRQNCYDRGCSNNQCSSEEYYDTKFVEKCEWGCFDIECKPNPNVKCSDNLDCPKKESNPYCSGGNVVKGYTVYRCENPGTSSSYCKETGRGETTIQACSCGCSNSACISPCPTCSDNIKNQDETGIDCGGVCSSQGKKCPTSTPCKINNDCQSNYCNPSTLKCENAPPCTNECSVQGSTRCSSSSIQQTCGNYDADACLEWGGSMTCNGGCSNNQCNLPDLTVPSFIMQYPRTTTAKVGESISMAFTIKNEGAAPANGIFWKLEEPGHSTRTNTNGISLLPWSSTAVFILTSYSSAGTYTSKLTIDPNNNIKETNEDNNQRTLIITVV